MVGWYGCGVVGWCGGVVVGWLGGRVVRWWGGRIVGPKDGVRDFKVQSFIERESA